MQHKVLKQRGNTLQVQFDIINSSDDYSVKNSTEFVISGSAVFQVRVIASRHGDINKTNNTNNLGASSSFSFGAQAMPIVFGGNPTIYNNLIFIKFCKQNSNENLNYSIKFTCQEFAIKDKCFISDDSTWRLIHEKSLVQYKFTVSVVMEVMPPANSFVPLHEDEEFTDFELRGVDGAVRVHRFVLAAASPVLKRMLSGTWRETTEGQVEVPETSKTTLQHLKDYIYLYKLPEDGLEQLLLLALFYMMPDLQQQCVSKLVNNMTAQNACDLLKFAAKNEVTQLMLEILESVQNGELKVKDIRHHVNVVEGLINSISQMPTTKENNSNDDS